MTDAPWPPEVARRLAEGAFLLVDKPRGPSSHQVTAWVRDLLGLEKTGHAGTLDPNVSGVLWVGVGPALKLIPLVLEFPKRYIAIVHLHGSAPDATIARVVAEFEGPVYQLPPVRSAVKRERRVRTIHRLTLLEREETELLLDVSAESGTYVRTLAVDLGEAIGVGGHMEELRRVGTGPFQESSVVPLTRLADAIARAREGAPTELLALLHPMVEVWREFPLVVVRDGAAAAVAHGADLAGGGVVSVSRSFSVGATVAVVTGRGELLATGEALRDSTEVAGHHAGWVVDCHRVLVDPLRFPPTWRSTPTPTPSAESLG
ncbi:MAG: RNA-guided pseudouridylation complex pseudouridine synthase subunit Cbf5 [Thermoplasmata archaeon]|nr:RNA-guided pseudouridylation complex pseudouridine synthase subunit Cbf5 [Thermoplasmata archaeon]